MPSILGGIKQCKLYGKFEGYQFNSALSGLVIYIYIFIYLYIYIFIYLYIYIFILKPQKEGASNQHLPREILSILGEKSKSGGFQDDKWLELRIIKSYQVLARKPHLRGDRGPLMGQKLPWEEIFVDEMSSAKLAKCLFEWVVILNFSILYMAL